MANQYYHFPTSATTYTLPSGDTLRFRIWYDDGTAESNTDTNANLIKAGPLDIPLEVTPASQKFRFSKFPIEFENTSDVFESESILNESYLNDTYFEVYLNGSLYWYGMVEFSGVKKSDWYISGGSPLYRRIKFHALDVMSYFWTRSVLLSDLAATYATGDTIQTVLQDIFSEVGISSGDVNIISLGWSEYVSGTNHAATTLKSDVIASVESSSFLKDLMLSFGLFIYYLNGKINIVKRNAGTTQTITNADILKPLTILENKDVIEYIKLTLTKNNFVLVDLVPDWSIGNTEVFTFEAGTDNNNANRSFLYENTNFVRAIYSSFTNTRVPAGSRNTTGGSTTTLEDSGINFITDGIESGDAVDISSNSEGSYIERLLTVDSLQLSPVATTIVNLDTYYMEKGDGADKRHKIYMIGDTAKDIYEDFFMTSQDIVRVKLKDLTNFDDIEKRYVILGNNHRARNAKIDFKQDMIQLELRQVT